MSSNQKVGSEGLFQAFAQSSQFTQTLDHFQQLCKELNISHDYQRPCLQFYHQLKKKLTSWKCTALWSKLDKKLANPALKTAKNTQNTNVLIVGAGPVGLRAAIECAMLGCKVVVVEKRNHFSRNNVLHFWPFIITDMKSLGAKTFHGRFCSGSLDHCSKYTYKYVPISVLIDLLLYLFQSF